MYEPRAQAEVNASEEIERPVSVSHFVHALRRYAPVIYTAAIAVGILYGIIALAAYLLSPGQKLTKLPFRLDFQGAASGKYPDGQRFAATEIVAGPVLARVFRDNNLARFTSLDEFTRSVFVVENSPDYERMSVDYEVRLSDPKLSPVDRERIQAEWQSRTQGLAKNEYAIVYLRPESRVVPETLVRKALPEILRAWAEFAIKERHVLEYQLEVLSPDVVTALPPGTNPVIGVQILRTKIYRLIDNVEGLQKVPSAELVRTAAADHRSLAELRLRLEEIVRFRLEPLVSMVRLDSPGERARTVAMLRTQLLYDERRLKSVQERVDGIRQSLALYMMNQTSMSEQQNAGSSATKVTPLQEKPRQAASGEAIMPQLSETFLDRLLALTNQASDLEYRRKLVEEYRKAQETVIPSQDAVTYDQEVLRDFTAARSDGLIDSAAAIAQLGEIQNEVRDIAVNVNAIYQTLSKNLNPSTDLFTVNAPPTTRTERRLPLRRLAMFGLLVELIAIPLIVVACLLHNRVREEDEAERVHSRPRATD